MSIRNRIWCTLLLVVVLPVTVCLYLMSRAAYDYAILQAENTHNERAQVTSKSLSSHLNAKVFFDANALWNLNDFTAALGKLNDAAYHDDLERKRTWAREHWQELTDQEDPRMAWFYHGELMRDFWRLQERYPEMKDILIVDSNGLPLAGSQKPQSYDQNYETWFKILRNWNLDVMSVFWETGGASSEPRRIELWCVTRDPHTEPPDVKVGAYIRQYFEFTTLFEDYLRTMVDHEFEGIVTDKSGRVLAASERFNQFVIGETLPPEWLPQAGADVKAVTPLKVSSRRQPELVYLVSRSSMNVTETAYDLGIYVFRGDTMESVVGPLRKKQWQLFGGTFLVIGLAAIAASIYMRRTISRPIEQIANVTHELAAHSQHGHILEEEEVEQLVAPLREMNTHDELNTLADEFSKMSVKALGFQRNLEHEVEEKTRWLQSDLEMAREFQQALLPTACPDCGCTQCRNPLTLEVAHFYQPAAFVSGDFYDYIPVNGHQIAVLIGDVMGHGARAALVTAILRALIEDIRTTHTEPAAFLSELNQRYHEIIERSGQMVFVSACYLLFDTEAGLVRGASAGHPLPLRVRRDGNGVDHLLPETKPKFPLGMMEGVQYKETTVEIAPEDLILLYTDGITEAEGEAGQHFGEGALSNQVASHREMHAEELVQDVAKEVKIHAQGSPQDDVCMVAIRVLRAA